jgi:NAD(P)-dependent dehydrogenase (short-subunit alcohol dehydrogenase family)
MSHQNAVYLILGATSAIAQELRARLEAGGAVVEGLSRSRGGLNLADFASVEQAVQDVAARRGRLDGLVNCAGSLLLKPAHITTPAEYAATIEANLTTAFAAVRAGAKAMMQSGGSIVLVSSAAGRTGIANHEAIAAAKAGVIGLTLSAAATYAPRGIRVNCVAPGLTATPLAARITSNEAARSASLAMHALGRLGEAGDVASAISWLLDPENSWVTGQVLGVDGGLASVRPK